MWALSITMNFLGALFVYAGADFVSHKSPYDSWTPPIIFFSIAVVMFTGAHFAGH